LDGERNLTPVATKFNAMLGKPFNPIEGNEVLMLSGGHLKTVSHIRAHVNSIPCQTNDETKLQPIKCAVTFTDLDKFGSNMVVCEMDCTKEPQNV